MSLSEYEFSPHFLSFLVVVRNILGFGFLSSNYLTPNLGFLPSNYQIIFKLFYLQILPSNYQNGFYLQFLSSNTNQYEKKNAVKREHNLQYFLVFTLKDQVTTYQFFVSGNP